MPLARPDTTVTPAAARSLPERGRHLHAADGGVTGADDRHARRGDGGPRPPTEQHRRRQRVGGQVLRVARPTEDDHGLVVAPSPQRLRRRRDRPPGASGLGAGQCSPTIDRARAAPRTVRSRRPPTRRPAEGPSARAGAAGGASWSRGRRARRRRPPPVAPAPRTEAVEPRTGAHDRAHAARRACSSGSMRRLSAVLTHSSSISPWQPRRSASVRATRRTRCRPRPLRRSASSSRRRTRRAALRERRHVVQERPRDGGAQTVARALRPRRGRCAP